MPEYLAPGVYVEEIDTGSKPIEGVSTSTGGVVGVTERGPEDIPILVTSYGEFVRWFGGYLRLADFQNSAGQHSYLPHAVEAFFTNGGKRLFVVRVVPNLAEHASTMLFDRGTAPITTTRLLFSSAVNDTEIYLLDDTGISNGVWLQIGSGSETEYAQVADASLPVANDVPLVRPLAAGHGAGTTVEVLDPLVDNGTPALANLAADAAAGSSQVTVNDTTDLSDGDLIQIGGAGEEQLVFINAPLSGTELSLRVPLLLDYPSGTVAQAKNAPSPAGLTTTTVADAAAGASVLQLTDRTGFSAAGTVFRILDGTDSEIVETGALASAALHVSAYADYPAGAVVEAVTLSDAAPVRNTTAEASAGSNVLALDNRDGLDAGDLVRVRSAVDDQAEFVTIRELPNRGSSPDPGKVVLATALKNEQPLGTVVQEQTGGDVRTVPPAPTSLALASSLGSAELVLANAGTLADGDVVALRVGSESYFHRLDGTPTGLTTRPVTLADNLSNPHATGSAVTVRDPLLLVRAIDRGGWGGRLRVAVEDQSPARLRTQIREIVDSTHIRLNSVSGIETGTILQRVDGTGALVDGPFKVAALDRQADNLITLSTPIPVASALGDAVRSLEFEIRLQLLRQPDPAVPIRNEQVLDEEVFSYLSMDSRHSRYVQTILGTTWTKNDPEDDSGQPVRLADRRSEGESWYARVRDLAQDLPEPQRTTTLESIRLGPEALVDTLPDGRTRPAWRMLAGGDDRVADMNDVMYIGVDDAEPDERTGLFSLRNEEDISIIAAPGRTSETLQGALIEQCEAMRFRFAVLDAHKPPADSLNDVLAQRQQFDTKYASLYHPWPLIPDPFPTNLATLMDFPLPPSGHVMGIYARTDIEKGVHKAPANEVVRGITGLQRTLNKSEHDLLNPANINVIRDFSENLRGIRVWGARVMTSDPDWKYVNVRRLLIFIEASIERGLQWVVFEPNGDALWARVRRSISNFLTTVWRNGALEGTTTEEAYFVKCDRTTMTQTDIDNGRLICQVGVAPLKPAEFVIIRIGLWTAHSNE